jgi:hypothetical protein
VFNQHRRHHHHHHIATKPVMPLWTSLNWVRRASAKCISKEERGRWPKYRYPRLVQMARWGPCTVPGSGSWRGTGSSWRGLQRYGLPHRFVCEGAGIGMYPSSIPSQILLCIRVEQGASPPYRQVPVRAWRHSGSTQSTWVTKPVQ